VYAVPEVESRSRVRHAALEAPLQNGRTRRSHKLEVKANNGSVKAENAEVSGNVP
jgi:hypothetical protein